MAGTKTSSRTKWIWMKDRHRTVDCHLLLRKEFDLSGAPSEAELHVAASDQYRLFVNGSHVGDGPARSEIPRAYYDTYSAKELGLSKGGNVIGILAHSTMMPQHGQPWVPGGIWADLNYRIGKGRARHVVTNSSWRVTEAPRYLKPAPRRFFPVGFNEKIDFSQRIRKWAAAGFDDSDWQKAVATPEEPFSELLPRPMPRLTFEDWEPVEVRESGKVGDPDGVYGLAFDKCAPLPEAESLTFVTSVRSTEKRTVRFDFGCDNYARLHLNGKLIWEQGRPDAHTGQRFREGQPPYEGMVHGFGHRFEPGSTRGGAGTYPQEIELREGWNEVRVWMWRPDAAYGFELAFLDPESGEPVDGICSSTESEDDPGTWLVLTAEDADRADGKPVETDVEDMRPWLEPSHLWDWDGRRKHKRAPTGSSSLLAKGRGKGPMKLTPGTYVEFQLPADGAGFIDLELRGPKGSVVDVTISEARTGSGRVRSLYNGLWQTDRLVLDGRWDRWLSLDRRAGRYLGLCVRNAPDSVEVRKFLLRTQHYPAERHGSFECSDWAFNRMWEAGAATVDASTFDLIEDCPTREKAQWAGDAFIRMHLLAWLWGDVRLSELAIREFARDQKPDGWHRAMAPCSYNDVLVDTCFLLPRWVLDQYNFTADHSIVDDTFPAVRNLIKFAQSQRSRLGFIRPKPGNTVYIDYSMNPVPRCGDTIGALQAQYLVALESAIYLAEMVGQSLLSRRWRLQLNRMRSRVREHFWVEDEGLFADGLRDGEPGGTFSAVTNYWMLFAGIPTSEQEDRILGRLWKSGTRETMRFWERGESPYSKFFVSEALLSRGLWRRAFSHWRSYYGTMLKHPDAMSVFEMWQRDWALDEPVPRNSLVHAFGIGPLAHLASYVAGVRPLKPGFAEILWEPIPGDLEWLKAELPLVGREETVRVEMTTEDWGGRNLVLHAPEDLPVSISERYLKSADRTSVETF